MDASSAIVRSELRRLVTKFEELVALNRAQQDAILWTLEQIESRDSTQPVKAAG